MTRTTGISVTNWAAAVALSIAAAISGAASASAKTVRRDVVVYGATPGGITAAIAAARDGASVVLLEQTKHVGGLSTSGLNRDETNHMYPKETFGGLCEQFLSDASGRGGGPTRRGGVYTWEAHDAEAAFLKMLADAGVEVRYEQLIDGVSRDGARIASLTVRGGDAYAAKVFVDATYEGDLMAKAGVSCVIGREARDAYGESLAGVIYPDKPIHVSPYDADGKLLPGVMPGDPPKAGEASPHPTPYNVRLNLSTRPDNSVPITQPANYDPKRYELLARCIESGVIKSVGQVLALYGMRNGKAELNNCQYSIVSLSMPGGQTPWCEATFEQREAIHQAFRDYTLGTMWFLKTDPRVPENMRKDMAKYGLCKDEWTDNGHWPWYLYVREGRRMRGAYVMTQKDVTEDRTKPDVIHLCSHWIDSHQVTRYASGKDGFVNEGRLWQKGKIYQFPYRALTPVKSECENLLVPVSCSATHVAFCTIRLEPTWMHLGEASGIAAAMAAKSGAAVQDLDVAAIQRRLRSAGIPLDMPANIDQIDDTRHAPRPVATEGSAAWIEAFFKQTDGDGNGTVSKPEWMKTKADYDWLFAVIDKDADGQINRDEYAAFQAYKKAHPDWRKLRQSAN
ncbi:MAG: FAD-dependent oxidoreductase [Phycisphaera sp.]|nr:FAD-dependent oxidoreductase [Phycisphaera sp.]